MSSEVTVGLFTLGGVLLASTTSALASWRSRKHAVEDRLHAEQREDELRWLTARNEAHADFLTAEDVLATVLRAWFDVMAEGVESSLTGDPERLEAEADLALSRLELRGGPEATSAAFDVHMANVLTRLALANWEDDPEAYLGQANHQLDRWRSSRDRYLKAARAELGLPPPGDRLVDLTDTG